MAWTHQFIDSQGRVKPCCRFNQGESIKQDRNLYKNSLSTIFNDDLMKEMRTKMLNGEKVDGCIRCYEEEESGKKSLRERFNQIADLQPSSEDPTITWLELAISNQCNLQCRMCDSRYSQMWFEDELKMFGRTFSKTKHATVPLNIIDEHLSSIRHIKFTGGEPLLTPSHYEILDKLLSSGRAAEMYLNYSTNLTIMPSDQLIEIWKKFKWIEIAASFDGIRDTWELVRYPSKWSRAEQVMRHFFKLTNELDIRIVLRSTISVNNILGLAEQFAWWEENWNEFSSTSFSEVCKINPTHLTFPNYLSTTVLPLHYKNIVKEKLIKASTSMHPIFKRCIDSQISYMFSRDDTDLLPELKKYNHFMDQKSRVTFLKVNSEFEEIFDNEFETAKMLK